MSTNTIVLTVTEINAVPTTQQVHNKFNGGSLSRGALILSLRMFFDVALPPIEMVSRPVYRR